MSTILFSNGNLSESFQKVVDNMFIRVDGVLLERTRKGYMVFGKEVVSMMEVKKIIRDSRKSLANSIKK